MTTLTGDELAQRSRVPEWVRRTYDRKLDRYPDTGPRSLYLSGAHRADDDRLVLPALHPGRGGDEDHSSLRIRLHPFVFVLVIGNAVGALASLAAGLADRVGRANLVVAGTLMTGAARPVCAAERVKQGRVHAVLHAALRWSRGSVPGGDPGADPRLLSASQGTLTAMAFWTMGPVLGSLVVTEVSSHTLSSHPNWQYQFHVCGIVGLVVWLVTFLVPA